MRIIECNIHIPNSNLDVLKDNLRNLGNRYIENETKILNISRHKLARAGNAAIALRACKLEPMFNDEHDIIGFTNKTDNPVNYVLIFGEIATVMDKNGYMVIADSKNNNYIYVFKDGDFNVFPYSVEKLEEVKNVFMSETKKHLTYCKDCGCFVNLICTKCNEVRDEDDFCSRGEIRIGSEE